jgi:hypothetical protein
MLEWQEALFPFGFVSALALSVCSPVFECFGTLKLPPFKLCFIHTIVSAWELLVNWSGTLPCFKRVSNTLWHLFCNQVLCPPNGPSGHQYLHLDASLICFWIHPHSRCKRQCDAFQILRIWSDSPKHSENTVFPHEKWSRTGARQSFLAAILSTQRLADDFWWSHEGYK